MTARASHHHGFDAAVARHEDDYLNRWPLAREIYGIATTGPRDWSVRVGIYGEWGTGKTSVLKFIDSMASKDGQAVIWFDPWEYHSGSL
jgi:predicted KAP-like P-loop ATPase